jgi:hypothetical protein
VTKTSLPSAPYSLNGYGLSSSSLDFYWSETTPPSVSAYWVYRWNGSSWSYIGSSYSTYYYDSGLSSGTHYYFVCADNSAGYTCSSNYTAIST